MDRENENIHIHIIKEDYDSKKKKQKQRFGVSEKAKSPAELLQNQESAFKQLERMHTNFAVEWLQTSEETRQTDHPNTDESLDALNISQMFSLFQKMKSEEQELLEQKQDLLKMERELQSLLIQEIGKKKKTIQELKSDVSDLQKTCQEISQALEISTNR
jgi:hypothetical protein